MGIRSTPAYSYQPQCRGWEDVISINNPDKGRASCVGFAKTCGRRCWNHIAAHRVACATLTVHSMKGLDDQTSSKLRSVAGDMLCNVHAWTREHVVQDWMHEGTEAFKGGYRDCDALKETLERLKRLFAEYEATQRSSTWEQSRAYERWERANQHTRTQQQYKQRSFNAGYFDSQQPEKTTSKPTQGSKKQNERQEWDEMWTRYNRNWKSLDACPEDKDVKIPWPTKSGCLRDINEANVRQFFLKGPPQELQSGKARYEAMSIETKRWHTDRVANRFGPDVMAGEHKDALNTVAQVVVELWKGSRTHKGNM